MGKHKDAKTENKQLKEEVNSLKDDKLALEERLRAREESHQVELESQCHSHDLTFKKYQEDTQKNLIEAILEWKSNLILQAQVVASPLDLRKVNFVFLKDVSTYSFSFDVYHTKGESKKLSNESRGNQKVLSFHPCLLLKITMRAQH
ncbi:hypothetical protein J1N35_025433 [Gossypium stocksii]|uniref:Uncharacterized protein n=1 Tax=Gossypium stocksii TaxID=47602 RepID=A0A9D3V6J4_9ROSI|nr:hypothetical protein J1N35_025433 [Gossypium stocksii]